jgi:hypothetical protein
MALYDSMESSILAFQYSTYVSYALTDVGFG